MKFDRFYESELDCRTSWGLAVSFKHNKEKYRHAIRIERGATPKEVAAQLRELADYVEHKMSTRTKER